MRDKSNCRAREDAPRFVWDPKRARPRTVND